MHISQHKLGLAARPCLHAQGAEGKLGLAECVNSTPRNEQAREFNCRMFSGVGLLGGYRLIPSLGRILAAPIAWCQNKCPSPKWCSNDFTGQREVWNLHILLDPTSLPTQWQNRSSSKNNTSHTASVHAVWCTKLSLTLFLSRGPRAAANSVSWMRFASSSCSSLTLSSLSSRLLFLFHWADTPSSLSEYTKSMKGFGGRQ